LLIDSVDRVLEILTAVRTCQDATLRNAQMAGQ